MLHSTPSAPRSSRRRRIIRRVLLCVALAILVLVIAVQIIFLTNIPRDLVISAVEKQFGLRVTASSLATGYFGDTTLEDVTVALPLADKPFLSVPELALDHTWLVTLLFGRSLTIDRIDIDRPAIEIRQDAAGNWNLQQAAMLLSQNDKGSDSSEHTFLPVLNLNDATLKIADNQNRATTIQHLNFTGHPEGLLVWQFDGEVDGHLALSGKLAPGDRWAHVVQFELDNLQPWLSPWIASWPQSAKIQAQWSGQIESGNLQGRLDLLGAGYQAFSASGPIFFATGTDGATFSPLGVALRDDEHPAFDTQITGGKVTVNSTGIQTQNLGLQFPQGQADLDARYSFAQHSATLHASWQDLAMPDSVVHSGDLQLAYSADGAAPTFNGTLRCRGTSPSGGWDSSFSLSGGADGAQNLTATIIAEKFLIEAPSGRSLDLSGLTAELAANAAGVRLRDVQFGDTHPLTGGGGFDYAKRVGWLWLDGRDWPVPGESERTVDLDLNLWANRQRVHLDQLYLSSGLFNAYLNGDYLAEGNEPVKARLYIDQNPQLDVSENPTPPIGGTFQSQIDLNGTLDPLEIVLGGTASGENLYYGQRSLGDVNFDIAGVLRQKQVSLSARNVHVFGGTWTVDGQWPVRDDLFRISALSVQHLSLPLATGDPTITGTLDGKWSVDVHDFTPAGVFIDGAATIHDLDIGNNPNLKFDRFDMPTIHVGNGWAKISSISLARNDADSTANANVDLVTALRDPSLLWLNLDVRSWPAQTPDGHGAGRVTAKGELEVDLADRSALGKVDASVDALWDSHPVGTISISVNANRRKFDFDNIHIKTMDGVADGQAAFDLDAPYQTTGKLSWQDLNLAKLDSVAPALASLTGKVHGSVQIQPATTPRPLGPLTIDLNLKSENVLFDDLKIGDFHAGAFLAPDRFILDDSPERPTYLEIAGGTIHLWGRVSKHQHDIYQSLLQLNLHDLQLDALLPAGAKISKTPGLLSGQITILGRPREAALSVGQGSLSLDQSDLGDTGPIAFIFDLMHILDTHKKPMGNGSIDFTIQNQNATITAMRYFDRGSEIRLNGEIDDLPNLPHSPIDLIVVGSARPLMSINIPGISDFDAALNIIQHDAISVQVTGTLDNPRKKQIPFSGIGQEMKNFLFGDSQAGQGGE